MNAVDVFADGQATCGIHMRHGKPLDIAAEKGRKAPRSGVGRGTFYNHFQDVYNVLEEIEARLSCSLNRMREEVREDAACIQRFSRILYDYYGDEVIRDYVRALILERRDSFFANDYLETLRGLLMDVCVEDMESLKSEKERMMVEGAISALIYLLLNCICKSSLTMEETSELIIGMMQNGFYVTLTNRFGIKALKNPFQFGGV